MERDEEEGLRAFTAEVGAYAGASYPERPLWLRVGGARIDVQHVDARWREEERIGFRVRLADGSHALLYYVPELDLWSAARSADGPPRIVSREQARKDMPRHD